ncbi:MAG: CheR family methyltransferase [Anaeromyxobacteraceae bacterium]
MAPTDAPKVLTPDALAEAEAALADACGLALTPGQRRAFPQAVSDAARALGASKEVLLGRVLRRDEDALAALVERAVVGETCFWRHPEQLAALRELLPSLGPGPLRLWSAGCASGEEAYTLAMLLAEAGRDDGRVLATDVSADALAQARAGRYGHWSARRLPAALRERWLRASGHELDVAPALRARVALAHHNLVKDPAPGAFDVVVCRNVLIHFAPATAAAVLRALFGAVRPGGLLVLGPVELRLGAALPAAWIDVAGATLLRSPAPGEPIAERATRRRAAADPGPDLDGAADAAGPLFQAAREAARSGRADEAERLARAAAEAEPGPEPWLLLAQLAEARGAVEVAVAHVRQALDAGRRPPVALAALAVLLARLGKPALAALARADALRRVAALPDDAPLRGVEAITAGALRRALTAGDP